MPTTENAFLLSPLHSLCYHPAFMSRPPATSPLICAILVLTVSLTSAHDPVLVQKSGLPPILHESVKGGRAATLRGGYYDYFKEQKEIAKRSISPAKKLEQLEALLKSLPARVEVSDMLIRSKFTTPDPATSLEVLQKLPGIHKEDVRPSKLFTHLYKVKEQNFLDNLYAHRLAAHKWETVYDCDTVLELTAKPEGQAKETKIILIQSEMDIDADGSDGPRLGQPDQYENDESFQPETSYRWNEVPTTPNPFLQEWETKSEQYRQEIELVTEWQAKWADLSTRYAHQVDEESAEIDQRLTVLKEKRDEATTRIHDITQKRHLVGELDPFIVVPLSFTSQYPQDKEAPTLLPAVGDLALVIYENKAYPAIVGDEGPPQKTGEASYFLARQIRNDDATLRKREINPSNTPFWDLDVTYLIFPGTVKPESEWGELDPAQLTAEVEAILEKIGGLSGDVTLHKWPSQE